MDQKAAQVTATGRKRKMSLEESELSTYSSDQLKTRRLETSGNSASSAVNYQNSTCESDGPDHVSASCCSNDGSSELSKLSSEFVDLEENEAAAAAGFFATSAGDNALDYTESREMRPSVESGELESTAMPPHDSNSNSNSHGRSTTEIIMPSETELEDFFATAEKNLQKKFIDKYNFDIVKDQPLDGRYEWVQIKLNP